MRRHPQVRPARGGSLATAWADPDPFAHWGSLREDKPANGADITRAWSDTKADMTIDNQISFPISISIPQGFTGGSVSGNIMGVDDFHARVSFYPPLVIPRKNVAFLIGASIAYSQPNIGNAAASVPGFPNGNNRVTITFGAGPAIDVLLPTGLYGFPDVALALNQEAAAQGWITSATATPLFILSGISATQKIVISLNPAVLAGGVFPAGGITLNFTNPSPVSALNDSLGPILGFPTAGGGASFTAPAGSAVVFTQAAPNTANFAATSAYVLYCSALKNSYFQGATGQVLSVFNLGSFASNSVMSFQPSLKFPIEVTEGTFSSLDFWLTDQLGNLLRLDQFQSTTQFSFLISPNGQS